MTLGQVRMCDVPQEVRWIPEVRPWDMSVGGESEKA